MFQYSDVPVLSHDSLATSYYPDVHHFVYFGLGKTSFRSFLGTKVFLCEKFMTHRAIVVKVEMDFQACTCVSNLLILMLNITELCSIISNFSMLTTFNLWSFLATMSRFHTFVTILNQHVQ